MPAAIFWSRSRVAWRGLVSVAILLVLFAGVVMLAASVGLSESLIHVFQH